MNAKIEITPGSLYNAVMGATRDVTVAQMCASAIAAVRLVFGDKAADAESYTQRCADCAGEKVDECDLMDLEEMVERLDAPHRAALENKVRAALEAAGL